MRFIDANDQSHPDSPEDPRYYAPRSARGMADPSHVTPQTRSGHLPPDPASSRFDEMREEAFAKFTRPLESQLAYERRPARGLLAGAIAVAIGATVIVALVLFNAFPGSKAIPRNSPFPFRLPHRLRRPQ